MNLLVLSATTKNIEFPANNSGGAQRYGPPDWTDLTYEINKKYADIHGYDFKSVEAKTKEGYWPTWIKIPLIKEYLEHYDYVFWIDADAMFCTEQPLDIFLGKDIGLTKCLPDVKRSTTFTLTTSGAMLFKNSEFAFKVLNDLESQSLRWENGSFLKDCWHEQGFIDELYVKPEIISTRDYKNDFYNLINREVTDLENVFETENFKILPYRYHIHDMDSAAFIYHAGGDQTTKQKRLKEVHSRVKTREANPKINKLMIVAHADDETIWGGNSLISGSGWKVVCCFECDYDKNLNRRIEFANAMSFCGVEDYELLGLENFQSSGCAPDLAQVTKAIERMLQERDYDLIVTHNERGEYGHEDHKLLNKVVTETNGGKVPIRYFQTDSKLMTALEKEKKVDLLNLYESQVTQESFFNVVDKEEIGKEPNFNLIAK